MATMTNEIKQKVRAAVSQAIATVATNPERAINEVFSSDEQIDIELDNDHVTISYKLLHALATRFNTMDVSASDFNADICDTCGDARSSDVTLTIRGWSLD